MILYKNKFRKIILLFIVSSTFQNTKIFLVRLFRYLINPIINPNPVSSHLTRDNIVWIISMLRGVESRWSECRVEWISDSVSESQQSHSPVKVRPLVEEAPFQNT
jgi:hypothetical protein